MKKELLMLSLNLFDGGAASGAGAAVGSAGAAGSAGEASGATSPAAVENTKRAKNPLADVKYGKQAVPATEGQQAASAEESSVKTTSDALEARKAEFERLITGDYKDLFDERMQGIVKKRIGDTKALEKSVNDTAPLLDMLAQKYGVADSKDVSAIMKALNDDNSFFEDAASERGLSVEQYKHMMQMEQENKRLKEYRQEAERRQHADQVYAGWLQEADQLKTLYPGFDLQTELQNPQFGRMLSAGVGVKAAFQALHHDDIMSGAMHYTAQQIAKKTADNIASRQSRPVEAGLNSQASAQVKTDVSKLTKEDRREIARRVARGEMISF